MRGRLSSSCKVKIREAQKEEGKEEDISKARVERGPRGGGGPGRGTTIKILQMMGA